MSGKRKFTGRDLFRCCGLLAVAVVLLASGSCKSRPDKQNPEKILIGSIRWDYWNEPGMKAAKPTESRGGTAHGNLQPEQWAHRLPFFARTLSEDPRVLEIREDRQEVIDREIEFAKNGGLDYWAFMDGAREGLTLYNDYLSFMPASFLIMITAMKASSRLRGIAK